VKGIGYSRPTSVIALISAILPLFSYPLHSPFGLSMPRLTNTNCRSHSALTGGRAVLATLDHPLSRA
jgi:hypothetical protein